MELSLPKIQRYPLSYACGVAVVLLSVLPFNDGPKLDGIPMVDKWTHMAMYGGTSLVAWTEHLWRNRPSQLWRAAFFAYVCPVALGALMELVQSLLPYRGCEALDIAANTTGATLATLFALALAKARNKKT